MKNLIFILSIFFAGSLFGQTDSTLQNGEAITYKTWVKGLKFKPDYKGYLYGLNDSSIILKDIKMPDQFHKINPEQIMGIYLRKKGRNPWKGAGIGAIVGFGTGALIGLVSGPSNSSNDWQFTGGDSAVILGIGLMPLGAITGALMGNRKIKIPIYGDRKNYLKQKKKLKQYSIH